MTSFKRVSNILKKSSPSTEIKEDLLLEDAECQLFKRFKTIKDNFTGQIKKNDYYLGYKELKLLQGPIDNFFDNVLVMDKDKKLRQNRLNLLNNISIMFHQLADFSKIVI